MSATLKQAKKILELVDQSGADAGRLQKLFPYFTDLLSVNVAGMSRDDFRKVCGLKPLVVPKPGPLLKLGGTIALPATTEHFITREKFVINTANDASVKISDIEADFEAYFIDKIEEPKCGSTLRSHLLLKSPVCNNLILTKLGGKIKAETALTDIYILMERQGSGGKGALLTNGRSNIFYVRDKYSILRAVLVRWGDGWCVRMSSIASPYGWDAGLRVFSHIL